MSKEISDISLIFGNQKLEVIDSDLKITKAINKTSDESLLVSAFKIFTAKPHTYSISLDAIQSISISEGGLMDSPFIQFLTVGEKSAISSSEALESPSCIVVKKSERLKMRELKDEIDKRVKDAKNRRSVMQPSLSVADELEKFSKLLASGAITQVEYDRKKTQLLS